MGRPRSVQSAPPPSNESHIVTPATTRERSLDELNCTVKHLTTVVQILLEGTAAERKAPE